MGYSAASIEIGPRDPELAWEDWGPGLHADEKVIELDTGQLIAISVEPKWPDNNSGLALHGWARWIENDGASKRDPEGKVIETSITINLDPAKRAKFGDQALIKEVLLALLGEPPTLVDVETDPDAPVPEIAVDDADWRAHPEKAPPGTVLEPAAAQAPMIDWDPTSRSNASIRDAMRTVETVQSGIDPLAALGM